MSSQTTALRPGRACVVGCDSRIGRAVAARLAADGWELQCTTRRNTGSAADTLDLEEPERWAGAAPGTAVAFLCAALTDMRTCDADPARARRINVDGIVSIGRRLVAEGVRVVFLSTNAVFSGDHGDLAEDATPDPRVAYGCMKADAERGILDLADGGVVVRMGKVLSARLPLLTDWRDRLGRGETVQPLTDLVMAPVSLTFAVELLYRVATNPVAGVFHASGARDVSYADFLGAYARALGFDARLVQPATSHELDIALPAQPAHACLSMSRTFARLGLDRQSVDAVIADLLREEAA